MQYLHYDQSPLGDILLAADDTGLTGLWFDGQKYFPTLAKQTQNEKSLPVLEETVRWLNLYFSGKEPDFMPPLHLIGTAFQKEVWKILCEIPYGQTRTYGEIAAQIAAGRRIPRMSPQAVGGAVGHNKISILVPCHRVVGSNGSLTGYGGGIRRKIQLLALEKIDTDKFFIPKKGTAL